MGKIVPSLYLVDVPFYDEKYSRHKSIIFSTRTGALREVDTNLWKNIKSGDYSGIPASIIDDLVSIKILVSHECDELKEILDENKFFY